MNNYILTVHDELLSNLILMNCNNIIYNNDYPSKIATIKGKRASISLVATLDDKYDKFLSNMKKNYTKIKMVDSDDEILKNNYNLSASEIIVYLILLHHYIVSQTDNAVITIKQINKEYRQIKSMNDYLYDGYLKAIQKLYRKKVHYDIKKKYVGNHKIVNQSDTHRLLNIVDCIQLKKDCRFVYNLGSLGKILRDSKNYSTIVPKGAYSCKYANINYLLIFLYLSRMVFINRNQKRNKQPVKRISLRTICQNICKYNRQGYNMNITYADVFDNNLAYANKIKFNSKFYEVMADDYKLWNECKERYYCGLIDSGKKKVNKCINRNRDLKMVVHNLKLILTILKDTHHIADFNLIAPAKIRSQGCDFPVDWKQINGKNWDMFMIEILFLPYDTQSTKLNMESIRNSAETILNRGKSSTNIERNENED